MSGSPATDMLVDTGSRQGVPSILVVDDVPDNLRRLAQMLGKYGYKVRPAQDGEMALKAAATAPPDLILLDIRMPGMDGYEVCRRLKEDPELREIPVIFVSALDDTADIVNGFAVGGVDYVTKPFQQEEVLARVRTHIDLRQSQRSLEQRTEELSHTVERLQAEVAERIRAEAAITHEQGVLRRLLQSSDHERRLIAYEIHDGLAQQLAAATMYFEGSQYFRMEDAEEAAEAYTAGTNMLRQALVETRRLINNVRPPVLDDEGIRAAIAHLVSDYRGPDAPHIEFYDDVHFDRLNPILENAIYRITQEGLNNACKYSHTNRVRVELVQQDDTSVRAEIRDWGVGFEPNTVKDGCFGLEGIRERARLLGGRAVIVSLPGQGTQIIAEFPLLLPETQMTV
jgi:signal transduction histidine kinase